MIIKKRQLEILAILVRNGGKEGLTLKEIAQRLGRSSPAALQQLRAMLNRGWLTLSPDARRNRLAYKAAPVVEVLWVSPEQQQLASWGSNRAIDWRFPLVSRIPDHPTQDFLYAWLDRAAAAGLLPPLASLRSGKRGPPRLRVIVYGSCARGDAGPKSDMDVLLLWSGAWKHEKTLVDLAHEEALSSVRSLDLRSLSEEDFEATSSVLRARITREALTIWCNYADAGPVEAPILG